MGTLCSTSWSPDQIEGAEPEGGIRERQGTAEPEGRIRERKGMAVTGRPYQREESVWRQNRKAVSEKGEACRQNRKKYLSQKGLEGI